MYIDKGDKMHNIKDSEIEYIEVENTKNIDKHKEEEMFRYLNKNKIIIFCQDEDSVNKYMDLFYKFSNNKYNIYRDEHIWYVLIENGIIEWINLDLLECKKLNIEIIELDELFDRFHINQKEKLYKESQKRIYNYINNDIFIDCTHQDESIPNIIKFVKSNINFNIKIKNKNHGHYAFFVGNRMYFDKFYNTKDKKIISVDNFKNDIKNIHKNSWEVI